MNKRMTQKEYEIFSAKREADAEKLYYKLLNDGIPEFIAMDILQNVSEGNIYGDDQIKKRIELLSKDLKKSSPKEEPKKRGRPAKSKPSDEPIELDRNEYAHARIRKDDEYMGIIKDLWHNQKITTAQMNNMMGDLEDNKYEKLEKALSKYTTAKPVLRIPSRERSPLPEPTPAPKKRGRPSKPVDTTKLKDLINEINEHAKHNPVTLASIPDFPKFPKASKPVKPARSEIKSLKNNIKNKAKRMISDIEHSDLMKYISQF